MGTVEPHGDQGGVLPRTSILAAGFNEQVAGTQLNRYCGSGLEAVNQAAARVRSGWEDMILAGGVESMSRVPMASGGDPWAMDAATNYATDFVPQGISADLIATVEGYSRTDVDSFAVESQERAASGPAGSAVAQDSLAVHAKNTRTTTTNGSDQTFTLLMKELSDSCHTNSKYYLTAAITAGKYAGGIRDAA